MDVLLRGYVHLTYCNPNPFKMSYWTRGGAIRSQVTTWTFLSNLSESNVASERWWSVVVVHDESIFSSNDGTSMVWVRGDEFPIMPKKSGRICQSSTAALWLHPPRATGRAATARGQLRAPG